MLISLSLASQLLARVRMVSGFNTSLAHFNALNAGSRVFLPKSGLSLGSFMAISQSYLSDHFLMRTLGINSAFRTDADISASVNRSEKVLQPWVPEAGPDVDLSLESGQTDWDQFEANKRLFGASSTYDENLYTTQIDRSAPSYSRREADAARIAREIERTTSTNAHMREERGQAIENDGEDEEDKYSGVRRDDLNFPPLASGGPNKYTPPARRAPTGQPTVAGAPVDPAIISAQLSKPESQSRPGTKPQMNDENATKATADVRKTDVLETIDEAYQNGTVKEQTTTAEPLAVDNATENSSKVRSINASVSPQRRGPSDAPTEGIEDKVLSAFHQFKDNEKLKYEEVRRLKAKTERTTKLNDLLRFSKTFKLKTPVPSDLVGILTKDPAKQEQMKAQKDTEERGSVAVSPPLSNSGGEAKTPLRPAGAAKFDPPTIPPPADRQNYGRGRQNYSSFTARNERPVQPQAMYGRGTPGLLTHRTTGPPQDRKSILPPNIPTPIPILDARPPPQGPAADQSGLTSPQRSTVHTPTSAVSLKFNVKASEFKPNAAAPAFNPAGASNTSSSPRSREGTRSVPQAPSPSEFFGPRKPRPAVDQRAIHEILNPIKRMKRETEEQKEQTKKDFSANGGIPNAFQTGPVWETKEENKTYLEAFDKLTVSTASPARSGRSMSSQQIPYHHQVPVQLQNGLPSTTQAPVHHHGPPHTHSQHHPAHLDESHHRMHFSTSSPQVYPSPRLPSGQIVYSPMGHPAQLAYGQPAQYFTAQGGPQPMQVRQYPGTPQFMHSQPGQLAAPMMVQQQSSGPYLVPQQYTPQMPMYSPSPAHVYPQHVAQQPHSGFPSPGRGAPMMMHQGSQQGHHPGQPLMYAVPGQPGQMGYPQQAGHMMRGAYNAQQGPYGSSPQHHFPPQPQQRMSSAGYGQMPQKMMPQQMQPGMAVPPNAPHQPAAYSAEGPDEVK
jgi:LsmAD domain